MLHAGVCKAEQVVYINIAINGVAILRMRRQISTTCAASANPGLSWILQYHIEVSDIWTYQHANVMSPQSADAGGQMFPERCFLS